MKHVETILHVSTFRILPKLFIVGTNKFQPTCNKYSYFSSLEGSICCVVTLGNNILLQYGEFKRIFVINDNGEKVKIIDVEFNLYSSINTNKGLLLRNRKTKSYWLLCVNLNMKELSFDAHFTTYVNNTFYNITGGRIERTFPEPLWGISHIENYIKTIEIDGELMGYENLLFVPLRGGQLLALNSETGKEMWTLNHEIGGRYAIWDNMIYKSNTLALYEIDAITGTVVKERSKKSSENQLYPTAGPIWAYEDVIILSDILDGIIRIVDRQTFNTLDEININARIANSNDSLIWHNNKLYVLDLTNTLHIFDR